MLQITSPTPQWAALRTWAVAQRDALQAAGWPDDGVACLLILLDTYHDLHPSRPWLADHLWQTCRLLAGRLGAPGF